MTAWEREAAFLAGEGNTIAIYRMKATPPSKDSVPLDQLQKSGESPIKGNYDLIHVFPLGPDDTSGTAVNICWSVIEPGDITAVKQEGAVTCWYVDKHIDVFHSDYSELPGLLENCGREVHKRSVLENLRQCQKEAGKSQDSTAPPTPRRDPER